MLCQNHAEVAEGVRRCARCGVPYCPDCLVEIQGRPYCAACKTEQLLDVRSGVDRMQLRYASVWRRFGAIFLDGLLVTMPLIIILVIFMFAVVRNGEPSPMTSILLNLASFGVALVHFLYEGLMLSMKNGQTVGKSAMRVRVVRADGSPISQGQAWGRSAMKLVFNNCICGIHYLPAFFTPERTTIHDMVAGTRVVETDG